MTGAQMFYPAASGYTSCPWISIRVQLKDTPGCLDGTGHARGQVLFNLNKPWFLWHHSTSHNSVSLVDFLSFHKSLRINYQTSELLPFLVRYSSQAVLPFLFPSILLILSSTSGC